ncbi:MAG TPA: hypothetical protein VM434_09895 [Beijerinckiaceae bacterium]|nr:hypothetical protein [Beijerinckiaceae bacterium]
MKRIEIGALLRWAYTRELPKVHELRQVFGQAPNGVVSAHGAVREAGMLGTVVDLPDNVWGVVPDFTAETLPHPDALRIAEAVEALAGCEPDWPEGWNPLADLGLGDEAGAAVARAHDRVFVVGADGRRRMRRGAVALVRKHAILGGVPDWEADTPVRKVVLGPKGKPAWFRRDVIQGVDGPVEIEVDGMDRRLRIPMPDAYQKHWWDPDPADVVVARAEYQLWRAALGLLVEALAGALAEHEATPSPWPAEPWLEGVPESARVLPDLALVHSPAAARRGRRRVRA